MQHPHAEALDSSIHGASDAVAPLHSYFQQLAIKRADVGQPDTLRSKVLQPFGDAQKASLHIAGQRQQFRLGWLV
jgi:hypothetical protein